MIILGVLLIIAGLVLGISILTTIGIVVFIVGVVLVIAQAAGHGVGGRYWY